MSVRVMYSIVAGICFGIWPLFMSKSGFKPCAGTVFLEIACIIIVLPLVLLEGPVSFNSVNWKMALLASLFGALGMFFFNKMISGSSTDKVGQLYILLVIFQVLVPIAWQLCYSTIGLTPTKIGGMAAAVLAIILLII